jgi:cysteine desulfuration protein SufE
VVLTDNYLLVLRHFSALYSEVAAVVGDRTCVSAEFGVRKPNPDAYRRCLSRPGVASAATLVVDDSAANVTGAHGAWAHGHDSTGLEGQAGPGRPRALPAPHRCPALRWLDAGRSGQHIPCMTDPFVRPEEATAAAAIEAINDDLSLFDDWMERYEFIIGMGRKLPPFPAAWANDAHRVPGCQSRVWMEAVLRDGTLYFAAQSDAVIVSGLIALLLRVYSGRSADEILATDPVFLKDLGLLEALSTNRGNGIAAMARKVREVAAMQRAS